jgi:hypothetical protein
MCRADCIQPMSTEKSACVTDPDLTWLYKAIALVECGIHRSFADKPLVNATRVVDLIDKHRPDSISCCAAH